jgi:uncharacterized membrane protein
MWFWVILLTVLLCLSYLADVGILPFLNNLRVPVVFASLTSVLLLLCLIGIYARILKMTKEARKEHLEKRVNELEAELKSLKGKGPQL